jgi:hypothetical protein
VVAIYSYNTDGQPLWYLASGDLTNNGADFHGVLQKFSGGQCMSCAYSAPSVFGDDGTFSIHFSTETTGEMTLPDGRQIQIQTFFAPPPVNTLGGLPITFDDIDMQRFDVEDDSVECKVTLTFKNTNSSAKSIFLYFDALDADGVTVDQLIFHASSVPPGSTVQDYTYTPAGDEISHCEGFSLRFNSDASDVF